ncbi:hypothetical protein J437_LFUL016646 [Ladona fulva]|uniref:Uncharacterized protein n=1 Tax=Ladona fulva TaxID=123851 RepID=A0A8K0KM57_LADFU|nr:hypothetical protein J437_LFUL016646 [Ladona fulva]
MLLEGMATTWWQGMRGMVNEWSEAVSALCNAFTRRLPQHIHDDKLSNLFICHVRGLFTQLPYVLPE